MWNFAAQSVHFPGPAQNAGSHLTLSFQVSTGWRRRKRSRNSFRNTRRQWGMSNAAFYQIETAEIKTHMEKKGVDVKSLFTPPFHHCVWSASLPICPQMHAHSHKAIPVLFHPSLSLLYTKHWWCSHKTVQARALHTTGVPLHASVHT